jgi:hypothetical protein
MVRSVIKGYLEEGKPLFKAIPQQVSSVTPVEGEPEVVSKIKVVLDEYILS